MNPKYRKKFFYNKLYELMDADITEFKISPEHNLFIDYCKYNWRFEMDFLYIVVDFRYRETSLKSINIYDKNIGIFNLPLFIKLIKFYYKCKRYGLNKIYQKEYDELPNDLKDELLLLNRFEKINKIRND